MKSEPESTYAWLRLGAALVLMTMGGSGMYAMAVALAPVQAEFGVTRGDASLPYTLTMLGFGFGGIVLGVALWSVWRRVIGQARGKLGSDSN